MVKKILSKVCKTEVKWNVYMNNASCRAYNISDVYEHLIVHLILISQSTHLHNTHKNNKIVLKNYTATETSYWDN